MAKCTFCSTELKPGTGKLFVYSNGKLAYFCSRTCEKNVLKLKRKPARVAWTQTARDEKAKRVASGGKKQ